MASPHTCSPERSQRGNKKPLLDVRRGARRDPLLSSSRIRRSSRRYCRSWHLALVSWLPRLHRAGPSASLDKSNNAMRLRKRISETQRRVKWFAPSAFEADEKSKDERLLVVEIASPCARRMSSRAPNPRAACHPERPALSARRLLQ